MSSVTILRWARMHLLPYARASHAHPVIILPLGGVGGSAASHLKAGDSILLPAAAPVSASRVCVALVGFKTRSGRSTKAGPEDKFVLDAN